MNSPASWASPTSPNPPRTSASGSCSMEVNIDTADSLLARFIYLKVVTPNTPLGLGTATVDQTQRLLKDAAEKTGQDVWKESGEG